MSAKSSFLAGWVARKSLFALLSLLAFSPAHAGLLTADLALGTPVGGFFTHAADGEHPVSLSQDLPVDGLGTWHARADADYGLLGASASVPSFESTLLGPSGRAEATATWEDTFRVDGGTGGGRMLMLVQLQGSASGIDSSFTYALEINGFGSIVASIRNAQDLTYDRTFAFDFPFTYGDPFTIKSYLDVDTFAGSGLASQADFTDRVLQLTAIDWPTGRPLDPSSIRTESGVDYNHLPSLSIPESASLILLVFGLAVIGSRRLLTTRLPILPSSPAE